MSKHITIDHILSELEVLLLKRDEQEQVTDATEVDARLGRMIRNMPCKSTLTRLTTGGYKLEVYGTGDFGYYEYPESAFEAAGIAGKQHSDK